MKSIVTVVGLDQVGIIAGVCNLLADNNVNVLDINQNIIDILKINLDKDVEIVKNIQFDFYENQYFYIDENNQKRYITKQEKILLQKMIDKKNSKWFL